MRVWWTNIVQKIKNNRRALLAATMVVLFVGLIMYSYTVSMRAAFLRMLEDMTLQPTLPAQPKQPNPVVVLPPAAVEPSEPAEDVMPALPDGESVLAETPIDMEGLRLSWPLLGEVSRHFGWNYSQTFADWRYHNGIDIAGKIGQPVRAARDGVVLQAGDCAWFGRIILIQHEAGLQTLYGNLGDLLVEIGETVTSEAIIAHLGPLGAAELGDGGNWLHFELFVQGEPVDPGVFFGQ